MFPPEILRLVFPYLDFESKQKKAVLVNKEWKEIIRNNSALSGHLVLRPPSGNATADEINEILEGNLVLRIHNHVAEASGNLSTDKNHLISTIAN